jgi:hypothetical protein
MKLSREIINAGRAAKEATDRAKAHSAKKMGGLHSL